MSMPDASGRLDPLFAPGPDGFWKIASPRTSQLCSPRMPARARTGKRAKSPRNAGGGPAVLVDCSEASEHELAEDYERELDGVAVIGLGARPGRGKLGSRSIEIVADPAGRFARAYGPRNEKLMPFTFVTANGEFGGGSQRVPHLLPKIRGRLYGQ